MFFFFSATHRVRGITKNTHSEKEKNIKMSRTLFTVALICSFGILGKTSFCPDYLLNTLRWNCDRNMNLSVLLFNICKWWKHVADSVCINICFAFFFQNRIERANTICIFCRSKCFTHTSKMAKLKTKLTKLLNYINSRWSKWKIAMNKKQQLCALINGFVNAKNRWEQAHENLRRWFFHRVLPRLWSLASEWPFLSFSHNFSNFVRTAAPMHSHFTCSWFDQTFSFFFHNLITKLIA